MATLVQSYMSLADVYKRTKGSEGIADIIELMNDTSQDILTDFVSMECNDGTKHTHTVRTGLPDVSWGALYEGIPQSKSSTQQVDDTTGFVRARSSVDKMVLDLAGDNRLAVRASESVPFIESMAQELITSLFYHNPASNPRLPKGLGARFGAKADKGAGNQIVEGGGTGSDNTSIWMVTWGANDFCALYPKGTQGGIKQEDKGEQRELDANGNPYFIEEEVFTAHMGFAQKDWRNTARIANIDVSDMQAGNVDMYGLLRQAYYKLHRRRQSKVYGQNNPGRTVIYCNTGVLEVLDALQTNSGSGDNSIRLRPMEIEGKEVMTYRGMPIRETDALLNTEAQVV